MNTLFNGFGFDVKDAVIFAAPLLATLFLLIFVAQQNETLTADISFNYEWFIVMPRNCSLKIP